MSTDASIIQALTPKFNEDKIKSGFEIASTFSQEVGQFSTHRIRQADDLANYKNLVCKLNVQAK